MSEKSSETVHNTTRFQQSNTSWCEFCTISPNSNRELHRSTMLKIIQYSTNHISQTFTQEISPEKIFHKNLLKNLAQRRIFHKILLHNTAQRRSTLDFAQKHKDLIYILSNMKWNNFELKLRTDYHSIKASKSKCGSTNCRSKIYVSFDIMIAMASEK